MEHMQRNQGTEGVPVAFFLKSLLFSYIITGTLLAILLYKLSLSEKTVSIAIIAIYIVATLFGGFVTGKRMGNRRFLWGLVMGCAYFVILAAASFIVGKGSIEVGNSFLTTFALCAGGGMLGGMLS